MENYIYTIPSYKRAQKQVTLEYLAGIGVPKEKIWVFVQTEDDFREYQRHAKRAQIVLRTATRGVEARNNILNTLSESNNIMMLDDDVKQFYALRGARLAGIKKREELASIFNACFEQTELLGATIFGVYPIANAFFMSHDISTKVSINTVFGFKKGFKHRFDEAFDTKEDAELCGRMLWHKLRVVRFNGLAVTADHRKDKNGYFDKWHHDENVRSVKQLCAKYPGIFAEQKGKPWEVRVKIKDTRFPDGGY